MFQCVACLIVPGLCAVIFVRTMLQFWYFEPYENIFVDIMPPNFCLAGLLFIGVVMLVSMLGSRAGNMESSISVNVYIVIQILFAIILVVQWSFVCTEYNKFANDMLSEQSEVANLMTYVH